jgi:hypothetical protein
LELARERYDAGDIKKIILASTYGDTALSAADLFKSSGAHLIIFGEVLEGKQHPTADVCEKLRSQGHQIIWGVHLNAISQFTQDHSARLVSEAYYRISEGFKVACEITLIAASQGFIGHAEKILSIAGTHRGADTAIVAMAAPITKFNEFEVLEILCKPYSRTKVG